MHGPFGSSKTRINSLHEQNIGRVGVGSSVSGRDLDSIVRAAAQAVRPFLHKLLRHPQYPLYAVQRHRLLNTLLAVADYEAMRGLHS